MIDIELNSKVELIDENEHSINGTLYEIDNKFIYLSTTPNKNDFKFLRSGDLVTVFLYEKSHLIRVDGSIVSRKTDGTMIYKIRITSEPERIQRRKFVRLPISKRLNYTTEVEIVDSSIGHIENLVYKQNKGGDTRTAKMLDISSGGVRMQTWEKFEKGQRLVMFLDLDGQRITTKGEIVHNYTETADGITRYIYGVEFFDISESKMDKIMKYIFIIMREKIST